MTKKMLVRYDPENPKANSSDFLVPAMVEGRFALFGLKSKKMSEVGMVVFTGRDLSKNDIFAKLIDTGLDIPSVDGSVAIIEKYLDAMKTVKIGDLCKLESAENTVALEKVGRG